MAFTQGLKSLGVQSFHARQTGDYGSVQLTLAPAGRGDGGMRALLAAKQWEGDLFLCVTEPGTTEAEVEAASNVCASVGD
jgi:hypothetical protein